MRSRSQKSKKQSKKDYKKIFEEAYLNDSEYRAFLIKQVVKQDSVMLDIVDNLAKLFQD